jgi:predicted HTH transcriptional regulator
LCVQPPDAIESEELEIKGWCRDEKELAEKVTEAALCLANAKGGYVLVGLEKGGSATRFSGCPHRNVTAEWLARRVSDGSVPPVDCSPLDLSSIACDIRSASNLNVFALSVPGSKYSGSHHSLAGFSKIRVGKECIPHYTAEDDRTACPFIGASTDDLSIATIKAAVRLHRKKFNVTPPIDELDFLSATHLIERQVNYGETKPQYKITMAALLLFGLKLG